MRKLISQNYKTLTKCMLGIVLSLILFASALFAGKPEYMKLDYKNIKAVEVKGYWDKAGFFVATDIEKLPNPRRPKLRGEIQSVNVEKEEFVIFGLRIELKEETQFLDEDNGKSSIKSLKAGDRVEVSCKIDSDDGEWEARKISTKNIKKSNKVKGSVTGYSIDGKAPDTLMIHDLLIILTNKTDVDSPGEATLIEKRIFEKEALADYGNRASYTALDGRLAFGGDLRQNVRSEAEYDLSDNIPSNFTDAEPEVRFELSGFLLKNIHFYSQLRIRKKIYLNDERVLPPSNDLELVFTRFYFLAQNIGQYGLSLQIGRQEFIGEREWLFGEYLDAFRVYYYGQKPFVFEVALMHSDFAIKDKYKTWTDIFFETSCYANRENHIRGYILSRKDSDIRNREPIWLGISYYGRLWDIVKPWAELSMIRGEDKGLSLEGSAFDFGFTISPKNIKYGPSISFGYASASGDKTGGDNISNNFRQTGYQDNTAYFGGLVLLKYYGAVLDPELSNIKILTLGTGIRPIRNGSIELIYHSYKQSEPDDKIRGDLVSPAAIPNEVSDDLGWEFDLVLGIIDIWDNITASAVYGIYKPGLAFAPYQNTAALWKLNIKYEI